MKKYIFLFISLFFLLPISSKAIEGIDNFYIDAEVLENGDIKVREVFIMNGSYNGMERIINYQNLYADVFDPNAEYYGGSTLHNGDGITINKVGAIDIYDNYDFNIIDKEVDYFDYNTNASKGDYGYYFNTDKSDGTTVTIFNPDKKNKAFYIEYTLENMAIRHNDVAELGWNLFSEMREYISHFEMYLHIPNNQNELRVWGHGPLNGLTEIIDKNTVKVSIDNLPTNADIDVRLTFDLDVIPNSSKKTNVDALEKIIYYEENEALIANQEREEAQKILLNEATRLVEVAESKKTRSSYNDALEYIEFYIDSGTEKSELLKRLDLVLDSVEAKEHRNRVVLVSFYALWFIGVIVIIYRTYNKYDKEYKAQFTGKYYRDFPNNYGPEIVQYLFEHKIDNKGLSSAILNLIADKVIKLESKGKTHTFIYNQEGRNLKPSDQELLNWLFVKIGKNNRVTLTEFKNAGKSYESFLNNYNYWKQEALKEAQGYNFFENNSGKILGLNILFLFLGIALGVLLLMNQASVLYFIISVVLFIITVIYFLTIRKRTIKGNEEYVKWKGLKNFISDFGRFKDRDLPDIHLWEKYLVYAHVFGLSKKLAKTMQIKIKEFNYDNDMTDITTTMVHINLMSSMNRIIDTSVTKAISQANSAYAAAHSTKSSGLGGGGGFSGGGGSFGGGGGGGRF